MKQLRELGQATREDDAQRGYWIGIAVEAGDPRPRAGELREVKMGGGAAGC